MKYLLLKTRPVISLHVPVNDIHGPFARENAADLVRRSLLETGHGFNAVPGGVWIDDDVIAAAQGMGVGKRLGIGGVG